MLKAIISGTQHWVRVLAVGVPLALAIIAWPEQAHATQRPWATGKSKAGDLVIELVTFGPGDAIHQLFGHTALLVRDKRRRVERLYNYGMFTFGPRMLPSFAKGRLTFWVEEQSMSRALPQYLLEGRAIRKQSLRLAPSERLALAQALARDVLPENREYLYDHYADNCSTRLADAIDLATQGQFSEAMDVPARLTLREHTRRYASLRPLVEFLMMHAMGPSVDRPITRYQELFLPEELERAVEGAKIRDEARRLVQLQGRQWTVFRSKRPPIPAMPASRWPQLLTLGAIAAVLLLGSAALRRGGQAARWREALHVSAMLSVGALVGLLGALTWVLTFATDHRVAYGNQNVLLATPLHLGLGVAAIGLALGRTWWRPWFLVSALLVGLGTLAALALKLVPGMFQDNCDSLALLALPNLTLAALAGIERYSSRRRSVSGSQSRIGFERHPPPSRPEA